VNGSATEKTRPNALVLHRPGAYDAAHRARSRQEQALRVAAQRAAILHSSCARLRDVYIGRDGGMAPAEQKECYFFLEGQNNR
jgi:hypothetical protein